MRISPRSTTRRRGPSTASRTCLSPSIKSRSSAFVELREKATTALSRQFLLRLMAAVPYKIRTVLTDNAIQFTTPGAGGSAVPSIKGSSLMANAEGLRKAGRRPR